MRNLSRSAPLTGGGTISGDLTVTGDMVVEGEGALSVDQLLEGDFKISTASATAFVVGDISEPANDIFTVDTDNGRVGIGTASPSEALEIAGGNLIFNSGQEGGASSRDITIQPSNNYADYSIITLGINDYNDETGYIAFSTRRGSPTWATTEAMRIDSSGNVGIGTDEPAHKLTVAGTTNVGISVYSSDNSDDPYIELAGSNGNTTTEGMKIYYDDSSPNTWFDSMFNNDSYGFRFRTKVAGAPVNALTILGSGKVGIGDTSPDYKLDVAGTLGVDGNATFGGTVNGTEIHTTATNNLGLGTGAVDSINTGDYNVGVGDYVLTACNTGSYNTASGYASLHSNTAGSDNTASGSYSLFGVTTGSNNTAIGHDAGRAASPSGNITTGSNIICLGDNSVTALYCADTSISSSDGRDKTDVEDFTAGLDFITQMRPVTYRWDKRTDYLDDDNTDPLSITPDGTHKKPKQHIGFISQEVQALEQALGFATDKDNELICNTNEDDTAMGLKYERLVPVLVNAIKELSAKVEALENA